VPRRSALAILGATAGAALLVLTWLATYHLGIVERTDASVLSGFTDIRRPSVDRIASLVANVCDVKPFVCLAAVVVLVAVIRRRARVAVAAGAILLLASETTEILKPLLGRSHPVPVAVAGLPAFHGASWPSGHATAAMSLALCSVLVALSRWRPYVAAAGAAFAVAVSFSFLTLYWHYPSDVLGGFLVAATWTLAGVAALWWADARWPPRAPRSPAGEATTVRLTAREALGPPAAAALGALALVGLLALARPHAVVAYAHAHKAFVLGAGALGALGLVLATGLALATTVRPESERGA
jgi:membrane-associated phospholipid phosphatase